LVVFALLSVTLISALYYFTFVKNGPKNDRDDSASSQQDSDDNKADDGEPQIINPNRAQ